MSLIRELKRRHVFRMALLYLAAAWVIAQITDVLSGMLELPAEVGQTVLALLAVGFPIAIAFSWFYEATSEGIVADEDAERDTARSDSLNKRANVIVVAILSAAVLLFAYDKWWTEAPSDNSIAVLCFDYIGDNPGNAYIAEALTGELINYLGRLRSLKVMAKSASCALKGVGAREIGRLLNVAYVLEGSVSKDGERIRINVNLIDTAVASLVWAQPWDKQWSDIFAIQNTIVATVVERLNVNVDEGVPAIRPVDPTAYELYLRSENAYGKEALELLGQAIEIDPDFSQAYASRAVIHLNWSNRNIEREFHIREAESNINTALELNSENPDALAWRAVLRAKRDRDLVGAAADLQDALRIHPNSLNILDVGGLANKHLGRVDAARVLFERERELDPEGRAGLDKLAHLFLDANRLDEAELVIEDIRDIVGMDPAGDQVKIIFGRYELGRRNYARALEIADEADISGEIQGSYAETLRACAHHGLGNETESNTALRALTGRTEGTYAWAVALAYDCRGDAENTIKWLETSFANGETLVEGARSALPHLRGRPRFDALLENLGISDDAAERAVVVSLP